MVDYTKADSSGLTSGLWGEMREWPPRPNVNYYSMRQLVATRPLVYHAAHTITEGVRGASWRLNIPDRLDLEEWLSECIERLWSHVASKATGAVFMGFKVGEAWFKQNGIMLEPQKPVFAPCETVRMHVDDNSTVIGYRQEDQWWMKGKYVEIPYEKALHWVYGDLFHNNPYGIGALRVITDFATDQSEALAYAVETSFRHAAPITFVTFPQTGSSVTGADEATEEIHTKLFDNRLVVHKSVTGEEIKAVAIQPPADAVKDIMSVVDYDDRQIALGLLVSLRTMYNAAGEGGSYNLVEVQRDHADQLLSGIIDSLRPGFERLVEITLAVNGYPDLQFDFDIEKPSELTVRATRDLFMKLIQTAGLTEKVDLTRLGELSGLPILLPDAEEEIEGEEKPEAEPEPTTGEKLARKVPIPAGAKEARQLLDSYYQPTKAELENAIREGLVKSRSDLQGWVKRSIEQAETVYRQVKETEPPELSKALKADWRKYSGRLWGAYTGGVKTLESALASMKLRGRDVSEIEKTQRGNLARKLADKTMASLFAYFSDLQRATV